MGKGLDLYKLNPGGYLPIAQACLIEYKHEQTNIWECLSKLILSVKKACQHKETVSYDKNIMYAFLVEHIQVSVYICVYTWVSVFVYLSVPQWVCICLYIWPSEWVCVCIHKGSELCVCIIPKWTFLCVCIQKWMNVWMCVCTPKWVWVCVFVCLPEWINVYVYVLAQVKKDNLSYEPRRASCHLLKNENLPWHGHFILHNFTPSLSHCLILQHDKRK